MGSLSGILKNRRGIGALSAAMALAGVGAILVGALLILAGIQRRNAERAGGSQASKDASVGGVEAVNQLIKAQVIKAYDAQYPVVDANCVTKNSCNTYYMKSQGVTFGRGTPDVGMNWNFQLGYVKSSGAPDTALSWVIFRACDAASADINNKVAMETAMKAVFQKNPTLPGGCVTIDSKVQIVDAKKGTYLELESRTQ